MMYYVLRIRYEMSADTQTILFGADSTERITAIQVGESEAVLYIRDNSGIRTQREPFRPWLLVTRREDVPESSDITELQGEGYRFLVMFPSWSEFQNALHSLHSSMADYFAYPSAEKQFLTMSGKTMFKGMSFEDVHRLQVDIETASLSSEPEAGRILMIAVADSLGFEEILEGDEKDILSKLVKVIQERDPDVIEGHNIFGFDLPFIAARARRYGVKLTFGRDGSEMRFGKERTCTIGGTSRPFVPAHVNGRHIIDTMFCVQRFDVPRGQLERYGLKECAQALGLSEPDRVHIPGDGILALWQTDPETVKVYARHDVRETARLSSLVCPAEFYLTQMVPDTYQSAATSGTGEKINSILIREYLRRRHAVPCPKPTRPILGGYTEIRTVGLVNNVVKCDVESLYPSLMLTQQIKPASDVLDVFLPALSDLTERRIRAKTKAQLADGKEKAYWEGLQSSFKILINSFFGYLGAPFNFNDPDAAEKVTTSGQAIVKKIAESIEEKGGRVIEIDTDGVYFCVPPNVVDEESEIAFVEEVGEELPTGVRLAHDGRYAAMLSLKIKNYVLVDYSGRKIFKGAAVRSRSDERFGREFISNAVDCLLKGDKRGVSRLYLELVDKIEKGLLLPEEFARRERVTKKTFESAQKKRLAAVAQGVRIGDYVNVYEKADGTVGLIEHYKGDEDRSRLLEKLYGFASRLRDVFGDEFDRLFPNPMARAKAHEAESTGQGTLNLFG